MSQKGILFLIQTGSSFYIQRNLKHQILQGHLLIILLDFKKLLIERQFTYCVLKLTTGLAVAALIVCTLTVIIARNKAANPTIGNIHHAI